ASSIGISVGPVSYWECTSAAPRSPRSGGEPPEATPVAAYSKWQLILVRCYRSYWLPAVSPVARLLAPSLLACFGAPSLSGAAGFWKQDPPSVADDHLYVTQNDFTAFTLNQDRRKSW